MVESKKAIVPNSMPTRPLNAGSVRILVSKNGSFDCYSTVAATATTVVFYQQVLQRHNAVERDVLVF